jgi:hypothetical protein
VKREPTVNAEAEKFNQIPKTCKSQQIWKPSAIQKTILQISTDLKTVRKSTYSKNQSLTALTIHHISPQHHLITIYRPSLNDPATKTQPKAQPKKLHCKIQ